MGAHYSLTKMIPIPDSDDYDHQSVLHNADKNQLITKMQNINPSVLYQYYVTEWEGNDATIVIIDQINADEWYELNKGALETHNKTNNSHLFHLTKGGI